MFVIFASIFSYMFSACSDVSSGSAPVTSTFGPPKVLGRISSSDITESSGIAASKCQDDVFWTHNDSGDEAFIYAINSTGGDLGKWKLPNVQNIDWEDIASYKDDGGGCFIYIGEIGDNKLKRPAHAVLRVAEPEVATAAVSSRRAPLIASVADTIAFRYPDINQDAETLMVHPKTGDIYVVTKRVTGPAAVYRIKPEFGSTAVQRAEKVGEISVPAVPNGFLTGGDISPDGRRMIICDYTQAYEYSLPDGQSDFAMIWVQKPETVGLGKRKGGESVCYSLDGTSIFATSEGKNAPIIEVEKSGPPA